MTVRKLASNTENIPKAKPIFAFLHEYESRYGDLVQVINLEARMRELFPDDPTLSQFVHRYSTTTFDPCAVRPITSLSQPQPKMMVSVEQVPSAHDTPTSRYLNAPSANSPKRSLPLEEFDDEPNRPRKFVRAESPLKAGTVRRLDQQKRVQQVNGGGQPAGQSKPQPAAVPLPRDLVYLLSIIPPASAYNAGRFSPEKLVDLIRRIDLPSSISQLRQLPQPMQSLGISTIGTQPYVGKF
jgi:cleavage stimulation factor subunit 3